MNTGSKEAASVWLSLPPFHESDFQNSLFVSLLHVGYIERVTEEVISRLYTLNLYICNI